MALARATISPSVAHGPYVIVLDIDNVVQDVLTGQASLSAALSQAQTSLATVPGIGQTTRVVLSAQLP